MPKQPHQDHQPSAADRAAAEVKAGNGQVAVKWKGRTWHVLPVPEWGKSWRRHLSVDDWDSWAQCILPASEHGAWFNTPATSAECLEFIDAWRAASGQDEGESQAS